MARTNQVLNGAQVIIDYLIREKVPYAFGLCGPRQHRTDRRTL
jgi:acetolactate synthase-1/2/3 large subunit